MSKQNIYHYFKRTIPALIAVLTVVGCTGKVSQPGPSSTLAASPSPTIVATALPTSSIEPTLSPTPPSAPTPEPAVDKNVLYQDDFANPSSGWPKEKYDNFFIGYHEPDYYHIDVRSANDKELVPVPGKQSFGDVTVEAKIFTDPNNTATTGNFRYGLIFRRSGDQYYAFTISPRTKSWYVLKSSPSSLEVLKEGTEDSIQGLEAEDGLRVDAKGTTFFFRINDRLVGEVSDPDYAKGEVGLYVQTFDIPHVHVHFDSLIIREVETPQTQTDVLYQDDFANPSSGWPKEKYDNYFIGYHEPDYYHIDVRSANDKELVPVPGKQSFGDVTVEAKIFTDPNNTATTGNFRYGLIFRRSGDQYYAFTISPRTKSWYVLKSSPSSLEVLKEGTEDSIQGLEAEDGLRVDAKGTTFFFRINDRLVGEVSDPDYAKGEVGLYVQTFDIPHVHVHFDSLTIRNVEAPQLICSVISIALNVRSGPSKSFDPPIIFLARGGRMEPLGRSPDGEWIRVKVEGSDQQGWIFNSAEFVSCNVAVADLPVIEP